MIPPIEAKAIREWVGKTVYGDTARKRDRILHDFLVWVRDTSPRDEDFSWQKVSATDDTELELMYARFLMTDRKEE